MPANMPRLRVLLLWLLMLALPLQGVAAAAMAACGMPQSASDASAHADMAHHAAPDMAHHAAPDMANHAAPAAHHPQAHAFADSQQQQQQQHDTHAKPDGGGVHKCSACSVCSVCHAAALLDTPAPVHAHALPQASPVLRLQAMASQAPRLPDKPPRA